MGRPAAKAVGGQGFQQYPCSTPAGIGAAQRHTRTNRVAGRRRRSLSHAIVLRLIDELGFDGVDAGTLDESWRQQPDTGVYGTNLDAEGVRRALSEASKERRPEWRAD